MAINHLRAIANCDEVTIVWLADKSIPQCRGFALEREVDGKKATTFVPTWVGVPDARDFNGLRCQTILTALPATKSVLRSVSNLAGEGTLMRAPGRGAQPT